ncbi:unnamed protein product [Oreochromis niloticus]|nr:unnamed protein product [Mustela putorius furo]
MPKKQKKSQAAKQRWKKFHEFHKVPTCEQTECDSPQSSAEDRVSAKTNADGVKQAGRHVPAHVKQVSYADAVKTGLQHAFNEHQVNHRDQPEVSSAPQVGYADIVKRGHHSDVAGPSHAERVNLENQPSVTHVCASHSQAHPKYGDSRNSQCTCNSLTFLAFLHENENITTADLNLVLDKGDVMYKEAKKRFPKSIHLATDELPDKVDARRSMYHVDMTQPSRYGTFEEPPEEAVDTFLSLEAGLSCLLSDVQYALLIMSGLCIAVFRSTSGKYGFFDPHSRTASGLPLPLQSRNRGTAVMLKFTLLSDMIKRLQDSYEGMEISPSCTYELKPVQFYSMSTVNLSDTITDTVCRSTAATAVAPTHSDTTVDEANSSTPRRNTTTGRFVHLCDENCRNEQCNVPDERKREWICHTCHSHLKNGSMPVLAVANKLDLADIPPELSDLNILERHLIAKCIPFAKIIPLPKGRQRAIRGNVVCVPSEVQETVEALPRLRINSQVMRVKLKRRLSYKGHQLFQTVSWSKLVQALHKLKQIHPQYKDVSIRDDAELCDPTLPDEDEEDDDDDDENMNEDDYDEADLMEIDSCEKNALSEAQNKNEQNIDMLPCDGEQPCEQMRDDSEQADGLTNGGFALESCLQPPDVAEEILCFSEGIYSVAPAERNNPISFFKTPKLEAMAFPVQFPTGQNTLDERRLIKVSPSGYFKSRLFCIDDRFAKDTNYLFFAQFVTEIHLATSSMTIQLRKAKPLTRDGRKITSGMLQDKHEVEKLTMITRPSEDDELEVETAKNKLRPLNQLLNEPETASMSLEQLLARCKLTHAEYERYLNKMNTRSTIILKRDPKDSWINSYNPHLLEAWNSNIDISFVLDAFGAANYLMKYISKKEGGLSEYLKTVIENSHKDSVNECDEMRAVMQAYSKKREISAQECVARACGLHMKQCSRAVIFIPTDDNPVKMSRPLSVLDNTTPESSNVWMTSLNDKYKARPETPEYEEMCMADFAATCRIVYGQQTKGKDVLPLLNEMGFVQRRKNDKPAIIRFHRCSQEKNPEQYYGRLLKLYLPHRSDNELKTPSLPTYQAFYGAGCVQLPGTDRLEYVQHIVKRNREKYEKNSEEIESAVEEYEQNRGVIDEWCNLAPESDLVRLPLVEQERERDNENEQEDVPDYSRQADASTEVRAIREPPAIDPTLLRQMFQNLNKKQACIFYAVRDWCIKRVCALNPEQFFFYINGGAGTGKSHLIKCIYSEASKILSKVPRYADDVDISKPTVLLTAFTGTAAFNISGTTLHSLLKLPRSLKPPIQGLGNQLDEVRSELLNAEIIVIDEVSMVSRHLFAYVDARLKQIKGTRRPFGGMSVIAVGDFYQLPPVRQSKPLCVHDPSEIDLWREHFQMITLTEIMRQKDDVVFAEMLNRIRVKGKLDVLCEADRNLLSQAITEPALCPTDALHIFATNKEVDAHNSATLALLHTHIIDIHADDYRKDPRTGRMALQDRPLKGGKNELPDTLKVAEGARVMLTRNIDIQNGLVNGAFGKLLRVVYSENDQHIIKLGLKMDNETSGKNNRTPADDMVYIERAEENLKQKGVVRRQFPVKLAFACTIHKVQGMTTTSAVVSLKSIFEPGMAYVAVSRVTSLSGLYLLDMEEKKIFTNPEITAALENMRQANLDDMMPLLHVIQTLSRLKHQSIPK